MESRQSVSAAPAVFSAAAQFYETQRPVRVVIVGGGFGGLYAARALRGRRFDVTLIDRRNHHVFQPLLYQVATGGLSPANIAAPLRGILSRQRNVRVWLAEMTGLDVPRRRVQLDRGQVEYDVLIVATGVRHNYFGRDEWEPLAPGLKTIEDATEIRRRIFLQFEAAEMEADAARIDELLTFVVVGGGPTGVELAGTLAEIARNTLRRDFRRIDPARARILLIEAGPRILPSYPEDLSERAEDALRRLGATVLKNTTVTDVRPDGVTLKSAEGATELPTHIVLWAAGVQASPVGRLVAEQTGTALDRAGRVAVRADLTLPGHPEIFVIGDLALCPGDDGKPLPGVAPVAMQQGAYVARVLRARLRGESTPPFRFVNRGMMATIGRAAAVADFGWFRLSGYFAWLAWLFIHIFFLIQFENRLLVMLQWAWNYLTWGRSARLITSTPAALRGPGAGSSGV